MKDADPFDHYSLAETVRRHRGVRDQKPALVFDNTTITYGEFDDKTSQVANAFLASGLAKGDRVGFLGKNVLELFLFAFGAAKMGAVTVGINWRLAMPEIDFILDDGEVKLLVIEEEYLGAIGALKLPRKPMILTVGGDGTNTEFTDWLNAQSTKDPGFESGPNDTAMQVYTSGTTGKPKGAEITNGNLSSGFRSFAHIGAVTPESVLLNVLPMFHIGGTMGAYMGLWSGSTTIVHRDIDPAKMLQAIEEHRVTNVMAVPALLQAFPSIPGVEDLDLSSVKLINYGASPISNEVLLATIELFRCGLTQTYGMTETTGLLSWLPSEDHDPDGPRAHLMRSAGKPLPGIEIRIVDPDGRDLPEGEVGEIWARSKNNMKGYWKNPEASNAAFPEGRDKNGIGWFATGDAGTFEEGYLYIRDRVKDMIISGAENIYPAEIENALMSHPGIADCAVIGIPSEKWGETPLAMLVPAANDVPSEDEITAHCSERLARYKLPSEFKFVSEIPRNPSGKILKVELRKPYWEGRDRSVS